MSVYVSQRRYFEQAYETGVHGWPSTGPTRFVIRAIQDLLRNRSISPGGRVLDLGCGEGRHTFASAEFGLKAVGLDYQPLAIQRARSMPKHRIGKGKQKQSFIVGDAFHLPFEIGVFDLLIDCGCFHHVRKGDTGAYLRGVVPRLRPEGYFILSCFSSKFRHHPKERRTRDWMVHRGHYDRFFKKSDIRQIFGRHFTILRMEEERDGDHAFIQVLMRRKLEISFREALS